MLVFAPDHLYRDWVKSPAILVASWMVVQGSLTLGQLTSFMKVIRSDDLADAGAGMDV